MFSHEKACKRERKVKAKRWRLLRCRLERRGRIDDGRGRVGTHCTSLHFCSHSWAPSLAFALSVSPLFFHSILSLYGHFTLTTGGLFVSLSGFASLGGHLREREPEWQNECTLEHTLSQKHIYRQVATNKQRAWFTRANSARTNTHIIVLQESSTALFSFKKILRGREQAWHILQFLARWKGCARERRAKEYGERVDTVKWRW